MKKTVLIFGLISGVILSAIMMLTIPFAEQIGFDRSQVIGYASMLAASLLIYFGIRSYRDNVSGGSVRFGRAFVVGLLIGAVSGVLYAATWQVVYTRYLPDFFEKYQEHQLAAERAKGTPPAELELKVAEMEKYARWYKNPMLRAGFTFLEPLPVTILVALISAGILSRARKPEGSTA